MSSTDTKQQVIQAQLDEIRSVRAKLAEEAKLREASAKLEAELETEKQALHDDQEIAKLSAQNPHMKIRVVVTPLGSVLVCRPKRGEYQRFVDTADTAYSAVERFIRPCVLYPAADALDRMFDSMPALLNPVQQAVFELAGLEISNKSSK
jgi:hypothetical protein